MPERPSLSDDDRRARLVVRHHLGRTASDVLSAVRGVAAQHSSDPLTPYLAMWARVRDFVRDDLDHALYDRRTLLRMHAMRRTLFVVPTEEAPLFAAGAAGDVARKERRKIEGWLVADIDESRVCGWLASVEEKVAAVLDDGVERRTQELTELVPELATEITVGTGKWTTRTALSSRLLFLMAMDGRIVRTRPAGTWRSSQYRWTTTSCWLGQPLDDVDPRDGRAGLARRYLATHGPATLADLCWWTGWTKAQARRALNDVEAVVVDLAGRAEGYVLADDLEQPALDRRVVSLLIGLDPTPMGWKERDWYLGKHGEVLFDRNGNAGPTVWADGRVVGGWAQRPDGEVVHRLLEDVGSEASEMVASEAAVLTEWLDGTVVTPRFRTPLERDLSSPGPEK